MTPRIAGLHHVTAVTGDAQRNLDFYTGVLGLRLVKRTVNFDDPGSYHLYYGDERGRPGSLLTFFAWPGAPAGRHGAPQAATTSFSVPPGSLDFWGERLAASGARPDGPFARLDGERFLELRDPDGLRLELVAGTAAPADPGPRPSGPVPAERAIRGLHGVALAEEEPGRTAELLVRTLGFEPAGADGDRSRYVGEDAAARVVDVLRAPGGPRATLGAGVVHHVAFRTPDDETQEHWRRRVASAGPDVTPVIDRSYFRSIYFREPGGVLFEIATDGPGFAVDEPEDALGTSLRLPPRYERERAAIESVLPPLRLPRRGRA